VKLALQVRDCGPNELRQIGFVAGMHRTPRKDPALEHNFPVGTRNPNKRAGYAGFTVAQHEAAMTQPPDVVTAHTMTGSASVLAAAARPTGDGRTPARTRLPPSMSRLSRVSAKTSRTIATRTRLSNGFSNTRTPNVAATSRSTGGAWPVIPMIGNSGR